MQMQARAPRSAFRTQQRHVRPSVAARVANINVDNFKTEVLSTKGPVLVDFWASWCGPCKLVAPLMDWAEKEYSAKGLKVVKIEHDANMPLVQEYKVYGLPALIVFQDGKMVEGSKREGVITKAMLGQYIDKYMSAGVQA